MAASGRPTTPAGRGSRSLTTSPRVDRRAGHRAFAIPNSSMSGSGEGLQRPDLSVGDGIYKSVDAGKTGSISGFGMASRSPRSCGPARRRSAFLSRCSGILTGRTQSAAFFDPPTAANPGRKFFTRMRTPGRSISPSIRPIPARSTQCCGRRRQGPWENGAVAGTEQRPVQIHGRRRYVEAAHRRAARRPPKALDGSGSASRPAIRSGCTRWWKASRARCIVPMTRVKLASNEHRSPRVTGRGSDFAGVCVDPKDPDTSMSRTHRRIGPTMPAQTFTAFKGAPGGDDYHTIWINPLDP